MGHYTCMVRLLNHNDQEEVGMSSYLHILCLKQILGWCATVLGLAKKFDGYFDVRTLVI